MFAQANDIDWDAPDPTDDITVNEEYRVDFTDEELESAGFQVRVIAEMPEHETEFIPNRERALGELIELYPPIGEYPDLAG